MDRLCVHGMAVSSCFGLLELSNVAQRYIYHGNIDRLARGQQSCIREEGDVGCEIITDPSDYVKAGMWGLFI